jgi:flagellar hook-basal body complex protein FliE
MSAAINGIPGSAGLGNLAPIKPAEVGTPSTSKSGAVDFGDMLGKALEEAGATEKASDTATKQFAAGDPNIGLHEVMIASEKAQISLRYAVTLKNKVIEAYRELMSTQL